MVTLGKDKETFGEMGSSHAACLPGQHAPGASKKSIYKDQWGRSFSGHWVVPPGKIERRTLVTKLLHIPYDTTIHCIAVHLHPFAESLELSDLTTGKSLYKARVQSYKDRIGLKHVDYYSSPKGIKVYKDHEYEMMAVYNNTSGVAQDAMATMLFYLLDKNFKSWNVIGETLSLP